MTDLEIQERRRQARRACDRCTMDVLIRYVVLAALLGLLVVNGDLWMRSLLALLLQLVWLSVPPRLHWLGRQKCIPGILDASDKDRRK